MVRATYKFLKPIPTRTRNASERSPLCSSRSADPSLALGPLVAHYGWDWEDWDRIAAGTLVGHLLECGAQVTGGYFADPGYKDVPSPATIGLAQTGSTRSDLAVAQAVVAERKDLAATSTLATLRPRRFAIGSNRSRSGPPRSGDMCGGFDDCPAQDR